MRLLYVYFFFSTAYNRHLQSVTLLNVLLTRKPSRMSIYRDFLSYKELPLNLFQQNKEKLNKGILYTYNTKLKVTFIGKYKNSFICWIDSAKQHDQHKKIKMCQSMASVWKDLLSEIVRALILYLSPPWQALCFSLVDGRIIALTRVTQDCSTDDQTFYCPDISPHTFQIYHQGSWVVGIQVLKGR